MAKAIALISRMRATVSPSRSMYRFSIAQLVTEERRGMLV
ncbi:hypothetical protein ES703_112265 [subsurface metagenome]